MTYLILTWNTLLSALSHPHQYKNTKILHLQEEVDWIKEYAERISNNL
jgi:hypothetical protein